MTYQSQWHTYPKPREKLSRKERDRQKYGQENEEKRAEMISEAEEEFAERVSKNK